MDELEETPKSSTTNNGHDPVKRTIQLGPKFKNKVLTYVEGSPIDLFVKRQASNPSRRASMKNATKAATQFFLNGQSCQVTSVSNGVGKPQMMKYLLPKPEFSMEKTTQTDETSDTNSVVKSETSSTTKQKPKKPRNAFKMGIELNSLLNDEHTLLIENENAFFTRLTRSSKRSLTPANDTSKSVTSKLNGIFKDSLPLSNFEVPNKVRKKAQLSRRKFLQPKLEQLVETDENVQKANFVSTATKKSQVRQK